jgi:hypothetical protein
MFTARGIPLLILVFARVLVPAGELLLEVLDEIVGVGRSNVPDEIICNINMNEPSPGGR